MNNISKFRISTLSNNMENTIKVLVSLTRLALFVSRNIMLGVSKKIEISRSQTYNICFMFGTIFFFIRNICDAFISLIRRDSKCQWDNLHLLNICQSTKMFSIVMSTLVTCRTSQKSTKGRHHGWHCSY